MNRQWIVVVATEDQSAPHSIGKGEREFFKTQAEASRRYDELVRQSLPNDRQWRNLYLESREGIEGPTPGRQHDIIKYH